MISFWVDVWMFLFEILTLKWKVKEKWVSKEKKNTTNYPTAIFNILTISVLEVENGQYYTVQNNKNKRKIEE